MRLRLKIAPAGWPGSSVLPATCRPSMTCQPAGAIFSLNLMCRCRLRVHYLWIKIGQTLDKYKSWTNIGHFLQSSVKLYFWTRIGQTLDVYLSNFCPMFNYLDKTTNGEKYWTKIGLLFDKNLTIV